ncbi:hypothetical protein H5410_052780 [Solanum commersonii]|uniref:Uncharacterized protein n=1 Tax=Solanum commersonii TaxID=4109 RepID=A0A9J5X1S2_SOLCO|nr:hypothetical protein H5410_052780 [Solanum commersonii]
MSVGERGNFRQNSLLTRLEELCDVAKNHFLTHLVECVVNFYAR